MFGQPGSQIGGFPKKRLIWVGVLAIGIGLSVDLGFYFWNNDQAMDHARAANAACERGENAECIALYTKALEMEKLAPSSTSIMRNNRGVAFFADNRFEQAARDFKKAVDLDPTNAEPVGNLGLLSFQQRDFGRAIDYYDKAIELNPERSLFYNNRGAALTELKHFQRALGDLDRAIQLDPNDAKPFLNRGKILFQLKRYDQAVSDFEKAATLKPDWKEMIEEILQRIETERNSAHTG